MYFIKFMSNMNVFLLENDVCLATFLFLIPVYSFDSLIFSHFSRQVNNN